MALVCLETLDNVVQVVIFVVVVIFEVVVVVVVVCLSPDCCFYAVVLQVEIAATFLRVQATENVGYCQKP